MFKKIAIIGLGLMGGSLAAACRKQFPKARVVGITRDRKALAFALRKKWIHEGTHDILKGARGVDAAVLCVPVDVYLTIMKKLDRVAASHALVMDVGSVKGEIQKNVERKNWKRLSFVGTHPMVGSHERGIGAASPKLYGQGTVILTRTKKTCPRSYKTAKKFWGRIAGKTVCLSPEVHDKLIAEISHLPHAVAVCLVHLASPQALPLAAAGFRDTTRVAASSSSVWKPIFEANKRQMLTHLKRFEKELKRFRKNLCRGKASALERYLTTAQEKRKRL